ncbi:MAG: glycosyltransferase family 4 protein [Verrucomicrobia bacterium]|nr:glycosyltransferase family 4 protein [Deltaproteobacteria bacterium]
MSNRLTILQVISQRHLSGAERVCLMLSESLQRRGHRVVLVCKKSAAMLDEASARGIETRTPGLSGKFNPLVPLGLTRIAREVGADLIHTHLSTASQWGGLTGKLTGIPVVSHVHAMNSKHFFLLADVMVACSEGVRKHLIGQGVAPQKVKVIYNGIESKRVRIPLDRGQLRAALGIGTDTPTIVCIAHLAEKKGQSYLISAVAQLKDKWPDIRCILAGTGECADALQRQALDLGVKDNIMLLGYRDDAIALMDAADCVILPSLGKEGLPLVLLEAALLGRPAVCSDIPGNNEVVLDGSTGFLCAAGDAAALAQKIGRILGDCDLRDRMGSAARIRATAEFTIEAMTDRMEALYRDLIRQRQRS